MKKMKIMQKNGNLNEFVWKNGDLDEETSLRVGLQEEYYHDKNLMKILFSLTSSPKSAKRISEDTGISITTVYRKIKKLKESQLVAISGCITDEGTKQFLYSKQEQERLL